MIGFVDNALTVAGKESHICMSKSVNDAPREKFSSVTIPTLLSSIVAKFMKYLQSYFLYFLLLIESLPLKSTLCFHELQVFRFVHTTKKDVLFDHNDDDQNFTTLASVLLHTENPYLPGSIIVNTTVVI